MKEAYIKNSKNKKVVDFKNNNLHLLGYSTAINKTISKEELFKHIFTQPNQPNLIPYVTSYYNKNWGFCISENYKKKFNDRKYKVFINSKHSKGNLKIAERIIKGKSKKEIFFLPIFVTHQWLMIIYPQSLFNLV